MPIVASQVFPTYTEEEVECAYILLSLKDATKKETKKRKRTRRIQSCGPYIRRSKRLNKRNSANDRRML